MQGQTTEKEEDGVSGRQGRRQKNWKDRKRGVGGIASEIEGGKQVFWWLLEEIQWRRE
jgi:hypothetical protein